MDLNTTTGAVTYFLEKGKANTDQTLQLAKKRASELNLKTILVASTDGDTGVKAVKIFQGYRVIVVGHVHGFTAPNKQTLTTENRVAIEAGDGTILITGHAFAGVNRAIRTKLNTYEINEIIAHTLRILGEGMKVSCEIALMAADAGLVRTDEDVIAIAGTGRGADTAVVLKPANSHTFFDLRVREIICKPRL